MHLYTDEQIEFVRQNIKGTSYNKITEMFNERFITNLKLTTMNGFLKRNKFTNGLNANFKKSQSAWNKGMKGIDLAGENGKKTQFKKGQTPINYREVGSERINVDGYTEIKVSDPREWKAKHVFVWEKENGKVPKGHVIIFGDRNRLNLELDNLILLSRKQLVTMNKRNLIKSDAELTRIGVMLADLYNKISDVNKSK